MAHLCQNISFFMLTNRRRNTTFSATSVHFYCFGSTAKFCLTSRQYTSTRPTWYDLFAPILRRSTLLGSHHDGKNCIPFFKLCWRNNVSFWTVIGLSAANRRASLMKLPYLPPLFMACLYRLKIKYSVCLIDWNHWILLFILIILHFVDFVIFLCPTNFNNYI